MPALHTKTNSNSVVHQGHKIPCFYVNATSKIQVIRVNHLDHITLEKVIFPGCKIRFEAWSDDQLQVHSHECVTTVLEDTISCQQLSIA